MDMKLRRARVRFAYAFLTMGHGRRLSTFLLEPTPSRNSDGRDGDLFIS